MKNIDGKLVCDQCTMIGKNEVIYVLEETITDTNTGHKFHTHLELCEECLYVRYPQAHFDIINDESGLSIKNRFRP
jgi:hypothetical protein